MTRDVDCPGCGKKVPWVAQSRWRPFCSERCKLVDLGDWAAERHVIPGAPEQPTPDDDNGARQVRMPSQRSD